MLCPRKSCLYYIAYKPLERSIYLLHTKPVFYKNKCHSITADTVLHFGQNHYFFFYDIVLLSATTESFDMVSFLCLPLSTVIMVVKLFLLTVPESVSPNTFSPLGSR